MSKGLPKVLIAIPTYDSKNYCLHQFMDNVMNFTYPKSKVEIYVADNSKTNANALLTEDDIGVDLYHEEPIGDITVDNMKLYVPHSYGVKTKDRYEVVSGEYYMIEKVIPRRYDNVDVCEVVEDTRPR